MPSTKKRINLTVSDNIYERLQEYKYENGLESDATACLQLIVQQLNHRENSKILMQTLKNIPPDVFMNSAKSGYDLFQQPINNDTNK